MDRDHVNLRYDFSQGDARQVGLIFTVGKDTNGDHALDIFADLGDKIIFKVEGVTKIKVIVSDDQVASTNPDGSKIYHSAVLQYEVSPSAPYVTINKSQLLTAANGNFHTNRISAVAFVIDDETVPSNGNLVVTTHGLGE